MDGNAFVLDFLQEELDAFASKFPNRFKVYYVLNQVSSFAMTFLSNFVFLLFFCALGNTHLKFATNYPIRRWVWDLQYLHPAPKEEKWLIKHLASFLVNICIKHQIDTHSNPLLPASCAMEWWHWICNQGND